MEDNLFYEVFDYGDYHESAAIIQQDIALDEQLNVEPMPGIEHDNFANAYADAYDRAAFDELSIPEDPGDYINWMAAEGIKDIDIDNLSIHGENQSTKQHQQQPQQQQESDENHSTKQHQQQQHQESAEVYELAACICNLSNSAVVILVDLDTLYLEHIPFQKILTKEDIELVNEMKFALQKIERDLMGALVSYLNIFKAGENTRIPLYRVEKDAFLVRNCSNTRLLGRRRKKLVEIRDAAEELDTKLLKIVVEESMDDSKFNSAGLLDSMVKTIELLKVDIVQNCSYYGPSTSSASDTANPAPSL